VLATGITFLTGLVIEMRSHLEWMRNHNRSAARPVSFYGVDLPGSCLSLLPGIDAVIAYLQANPAALINGRNDQMRTIIRTAIVVAVFGAAGLGLANVAVAAPLNDPAGLCSYHDDHGNCQVAASGPSRNIDIVFPSNDPQEQAIVDYLTKVDNDFNTNTGPGTLDNPRPTQELDVTSTGYTSGTPAMGTQTTVVKVYQNTGGAHPLTRYKGFSYNNATKAPITFDTLFRPGSQPLGVILPIVAQEMTHQAGQPITIDPSVGLDPANYQNFAITNDAVIFFFDQNQMHPAYGDIQVSVPRTAIANVLNLGI
jgi:Protein of unknown function (DUF3298)/Erythromycin esterase